MLYFSMLAYNPNTSTRRVVYLEPLLPPSPPAVPTSGATNVPLTGQPPTPRVATQLLATPAGPQRHTSQETQRRQGRSPQRWPLTKRTEMSDYADTARHSSIETRDTNRTPNRHGSLGGPLLSSMQGAAPSPLSPSVPASALQPLAAPCCKLAPWSRRVAQFCSLGTRSVCSRQKDVHVSFVLPRLCRCVFFFLCCALPLLPWKLGRPAVPQHLVSTLLRLFYEHILFFHMLSFRTNALLMTLASISLTQGLHRSLCCRTTSYGKQQLQVIASTLRRPPAHVRFASQDQAKVGTLTRDIFEDPPTASRPGDSYVSSSRANISYNHTRCCRLSYQPSGANNHSKIGSDSSWRTSTTMRLKHLTSAMLIISRLQCVAWTDPKTYSPWHPTFTHMATTGISWRPTSTTPTSHLHPAAACTSSTQ